MEHISLDIYDLGAVGVLCEVPGVGGRIFIFMAQLGQAR